MDKEKLIGQEKASGVIKSALSNITRGKGSFIFVSGEAGSGKTALLKSFADSGEKDNIVKVFVETQAPVGSFRIGNIQPLLPFTYLVEFLLDKNYLSPEKKLAMNAGLTMLAAIPFAGDVFYAVKELGRDWRQFKREKSSESARKVSSAAADYYDTIRSYADKTPLAIFFDDMHWSDAQSVELLGLLADNIDSIPLLVVVSYKNSILDTFANPLLSLVRKYAEHPSEHVSFVELEAMSPAEISRFCKHQLSGYIQNKYFETWLFERSSGVPGIISDYLKYFSKNSPFQADGTLIDNFADSEYLPATVQSVFSETLEKLNDEEKNILAICSAEGRTFTALIVSHLLNTDILTAIKKLRSLQNKTGIIRSTGAHMRYGVKTTIYEFTRTFYQSFFENTLEYEERVALHGQIAALLRQKYEEAANEYVRQQLAPYIAAHSAESGDDDTARAMLLVAAKAARQYGNEDIVREAYDTYIKISKDNPESESTSPQSIEFQELVRSALTDGGNGSGPALATDDDAALVGVKYIDFNTIRRAIVEDYHNNKLKIAADKAISYLETNSNRLSAGEQSQLLSLLIKIFIDLNDLSSAEKYATQAQTLVESSSSAEALCFIYNSLAALKLKQGNNEEAQVYLSAAADKSSQLPPELRLLTLSNIAMMLSEQSPEKAKKYFEAVRRLSSSLNFEEFASDVLR